MAGRETAMLENPEYPRPLTARTRKQYGVSGVRPVMVAEVPDMPAAAWTKLMPSIDFSIVNVTGSAALFVQERPNSVSDVEVTVNAVGAGTGVVDWALELSE